MQVFNLLMEGSLEERISELKTKQKSFYLLFGASEEFSLNSGSSSSLSRDDFQELLKVRSED